MFRLALIAVLAAAAASGGSMTPPRKTETIAPARDGNVAIAEELALTRKAGTVEAYDLFIARHPDHPLTQTARRERDRLAAARPWQR